MSEARNSGQVSLSLEKISISIGKPFLLLVLWVIKVGDFRFLLIRDGRDLISIKL